MRDTMHNPSRRGFALVLLILLLANCAGRKSSGVIYHDENVDFSLFQTIAVLPFVNLSPASNAAERTRDVFMTMLQATGALYVLPPGEVERGIKRASVGDSEEPTPEEVVKLARLVEADAVITGIVREYGELRSGSASANVISLSLQMMEAETGRVVWSASSTQGGVTAGDRLLGGGGRPLNVVTQKAVNDLLDKLFSN